MPVKIMLQAILSRKETLEQRYIKACSQLDADGSKLTAGNAAALRTQCKRDIQILDLVIWLLRNCKHTFIDSDDAVDGYMRLAKPIERHRSKCKNDKEQ